MISSWVRKENINADHGCYTRHTRIYWDYSINVSQTHGLLCRPDFIRTFITSKTVINKIMNRLIPLWNTIRGALLFLSCNFLLNCHIKGHINNNYAIKENIDLCLLVSRSFTFDTEIITYINKLCSRLSFYRCTFIFFKIIFQLDTMFFGNNLIKIQIHLLILAKGRQRSNQFWFGW